MKYFLQNKLIIIHFFIANAEIERELVNLPLNPILGTPTLRSMSMSNLDVGSENLEVARAQSVEDLRFVRILSNLANGAGPGRGGGVRLLPEQIICDSTVYAD